MVIQVESDDPVAVATESELAPVSASLQATRLQMSDERDLQRRVTSFLWNQSVPALRWLVIEVDGNSVALHGLVRTFYEKQLAVHCCRRVAGVLDVVDAIQVQAAE